MSQPNPPHAADKRRPGAVSKRARVARAALQGTAVGVAVLEAVSVQARPDAIQSVRVSTRNTPVPSGDTYQLGRGLLAAGDVIGALAAFRQALVDAPQSVDALNGIAVCYDRLGRYDVSRSYYDSALALAPGSVLVLNNLGYSLYLQGELRAAIPILQQVTASSDPAAAATSRRVLQLVAVRLQAEAARASASVALAEAAAPRARIELAADGEQRLVFSARAPAPELVASLGDAANLVIIAKPMTARQERAISREAGTNDRAEAAAIAANLATLEVPAEVPAAAPITALSSAAATARFVAAFPTNASTSARDLPTSTTLATIAPGVSAPARVIPQRKARRATPAANFTPAELSIAVTPNPAIAKRASRARGGGDTIVTAQLASGDARSVDSAPAWLLASRRSDRPGSSIGVTGQTPEDASGAVAFDSDDRALNAFAERMRGEATDGFEVPVDVAIAVARLEALIARIRSL